MRTRSPVCRMTKSLSSKIPSPTSLLALRCSLRLRFSPQLSWTWMTCSFECEIGRTSQQYLERQANGEDDEEVEGLESAQICHPFFRLVFCARLRRPATTHSTNQLSRSPFPVFRPAATQPAIAARQDCAEGAQCPPAGVPLELKRPSRSFNVIDVHAD